MKLAITDANIFIDLIKLQILPLLFCIDMEIHTSKEIVDQLIDQQAEEVNIFINKGRLNVHLFSAAEFQEILDFEAPRALEIADKSVAWLQHRRETLKTKRYKTVHEVCGSGQLIKSGNRNLLIRKA